MKTYTTLQELTGHEAGAVLYEDGHIWIGNWSDVNGLPRLFCGGAVGLGEHLKARRTATPDVVRRAMQDHERNQGDPISRSGFRSWAVNDAIVTVQAEWN